MALYPGAVFKPTSFGGKVKRNRQGRGMLHVAVSDRASYPPNSPVTWHGYIAKAAPDGSTDGSGGPAYMEQYVDTDFRAYGGADGNDDQLIIETAGGLGSSAQLNAEPWTRAQQMRIIDFMRWEAKQPGGAPLALLPDARPGRRGWGPHRLGIKHSRGLVPGWWFPGCEMWSTKLGKECPGNTKVAQIPGLIAEAREGTATSVLPALELGDDDVATIQDNKGNIWKATPFTLEWVSTTDGAAVLETAFSNPRQSLSEGQVGILRKEIAQNAAALKKVLGI